MRSYRTLGPVRAVTFDLDDTLYDNTPVIAAAESWYEAALACHPMLRSSELRLCPGRVRRMVLREFPELEHDVTLLRAEILTRIFLDAGMAPADARREGELMTRRFIQVRSAFRIPPETFAILRNLGRRYPLVALSNGNMDPVRTGISSFFRSCIMAGGGRRAKPAPDLFAQAAALAGVEPGQILHVGDDPETDILGARNAGMQTCMICPRGLFCRPERVRLLPDLVIRSLKELELVLL